MIDFINITLPDNFKKVLQELSGCSLDTSQYFSDWVGLLKKEKIKEQKELRLKKIKNINAKYK